MMLFAHLRMADFPTQEVGDKVVEWYQTANVKGLGFVCHGVSALIEAYVDGVPLVSEREVTGFTNAEEDIVNIFNLK